MWPVGCGEQRGHRRCQQRRGRKRWLANGVSDGGRAPEPPETDGEKGRAGASCLKTKENVRKIHALEVEDKLWRVRLRCNEKLKSKKTGL